MLSRLFVPDTYNYMIAGYVVLTLVLSMYIATIVVRWKKARQMYLRFIDTE